MRGYLSVRTTVVSQPEHPSNSSPPSPRTATPSLAPSSLFDSSRERNVSRMSQGCMPHKVFNLLLSLSILVLSFFIFRIIFLDVEQTCTALVKFRGSTRTIKGRVRVFGRRTCVGIKNVRRMTDRNVICDNCR